MINRSQLEWRCRRGTKELDILLQTWLRQEYECSTEVEQQAFLTLLEWPDDQLIHYLIGSEEPNQPYIKALVGKIRSLSLHSP